ncbi:sporulation protein [Micromonospora sp. BRA006-A]|nr:sporulation protein [Micromonospora sp. BRA006-A]
MVFKKMLSAFGVGGPSVDTVLTNPNTRPGLTLDGHVNLVGGDSPARIEQTTSAWSPASRSRVATTSTRA